VLISSADKFALINRYTEQELGLFALFEQLNLKQLDLILVEGFKREIFPKIELQRQALNHPNIFETRLWCTQLYELCQLLDCA
jgi:molybdopterin molybdotransferase